MIKTHLESVWVSFRAIPQTNFFVSMVSEAKLIFFLENQEIFANVILSLLPLITLSTMWIFVGKKAEVKVVHF